MALATRGELVEVKRLENFQRNSSGLAARRVLKREMIIGGLRIRKICEFLTTKFSEFSTMSQYVVSWGT